MSNILLVNISYVSSSDLPKNVKVVTTLRKLSFMGHIARAFCRRVCPWSLRFFEDYSRLDELLRQVDTVLLFDYKGLENLMNRIELKAPHIKKIVFYWNALGSSKPINRPGWTVCTFDPGDADKYAMLYVGQFFIPHMMPHKEIDNDICFVGRNKGRFAFLRSLQKSLQDSVKTDFHYVSLMSMISKRYDKPFSYSAYLAIEAASKALLEILVPWQTGISLRTLEALQSGKKLVTNNVGIKGYRWYDAKRIFVLEKDFDQELLVKFLQEPSTETLVDISQYGFVNWLERVCSGKRCNDFK